MSDTHDPYAPPTSGQPPYQGAQPLPAPWSTGTPAETAGWSDDTVLRAPEAPYAAPYVPPSAGTSYPSGVPYRPRQTNGMAIASLVLGILWLYWVGSVLALVFGYVALGQVRRAPADAPQDGRGIAIAGIVLGWVGVATFLLVVVWLLVMASSY